MVNRSLFFILFWAVFSSISFARDSVSIVSETTIASIHRLEKQAERIAANAIIEKQLAVNAELNEYALVQTNTLNSLLQENSRIQNVLAGLTQTQKNIEEQISVLQGTLLLSRIINKQLQALPTTNITGNLGQNITDIRVMLFDISQQKNELYNTQENIKKLADKYSINFTNSEKRTLTTILTERNEILDNILTTLNTQLDTSIIIENNQKQVRAISSELQTKLHQQSFWVKSNNPLYSSLWYSNFISLAFDEITELSNYIGFDNILSNLPLAVSFFLILLAIYAVIIWKKKSIKQRLSKLAEQVKTKNDSQWHTPAAMVWTLILALPSTLIFLGVYSLLVFLFFSQPLAGWRFGLQLTSYWWFFATILALLRPNGIAFRHFGMPQASNKTFQSIIKESIWITVLLIACSVFTQVEIIGYSNDVIGQIVTIAALAVCILVVRPQLNRGIQEYENARTEDGKKRNITLFNLLRLVLFFVPLTLIVLIVMGYYYTAVFLIEHLLNSYIIVLFWIFGRYFIYRALWISSRRMASRRLQDKLQKFKSQLPEDKDDQRLKISKGETIRISTVNEQLTRMVDIIGWVILLGMLYVIWSDLISIAYYLDGFILWEQVENTAQGMQIESVTLLNLMRAFLYIVVTYILVRNLKGILEAFLFSRFNFSKGSSHTFTAVTTYSIVTIGSILAFSALGISWGKIQWIFTALSVGLGFGVREIFGSFVSGTILLFERPIRIGDKVSVGQHTGIISKIQLRSTTLINSDHMEVVLPNQAFVTGNFINWTLNNTITRLQLLIKINYDADLDLVHRLMYQAISEAPKVLSDPAPEINILQFKDYALEHELLVFVGKIRDRTPTINFLYYRINQLFKENQIRFEFNQLDLNIQQETDSGENLQAVKFSENFAK